ncbi:spondin domain-containing protein [Neptunicella marina]|uniref:Spondin domain-containing protein n=1 Tax=Neptunicella marina TaxID=2125989 RepID=A0A8J6IX76_9ALTE|nr:spondin domain-containing protein [Neptunicella marina]MBC3767714.1 spondin domain-containing protein [Neptunicella marina]
MHKSCRFVLPALAAFVLAACGGSSNNDHTPVVQPPPPPAPVTYSYEVTVVNLTNGQPLSPVAVVLHQEGHLWTVGESASEALELMAEGGDNSEILAMENVMASASGEAPVGPGHSDTITVSIEDVADANLSVATMLVNTNDAFTGLDSVDLAELEVGASWSTMSMAYDAGTEANSELQSTIPGPAAGGNGFDAARDDVDFVAMHPGVVTKDDGLMESVLTSHHRFDNPVAKIIVTRMQ